MVINKLAIIAGASHGIGRAFYDKFRKQDQTRVIGISRGNSADERIDLLNSSEAYDFTRRLDLGKTSRIVYLHSIGIDKFEPDGKPHIDEDGDGIDDEVLASNYSTFVHLAEPLIDLAKERGIHLTLGAIGSISDAFMVPYWQSFSRSKNKVRRFCKSIHERNIGSLVLNVGSTLDDDGGTYGRTHADTTYWQTPEELAHKSFEILDGFYKSSSTYAEFDFFKFHPSFSPDYFTDLPQLYATWQRDLGFEGKEVPHGIRI